MRRFAAGCAPALAALALLLAGWPGASQAAKSDDTVVMALGSPQPTMDPRDHRARVGIIKDWHVYDPILRRDSRTGKVKPALALSVKPVDELTWEVKLRRGVKFHNGEPFNAEAVKYTIDSMKDPANKFLNRGNATWVSEVVVKEPYTVHILTKKPFPLVEELLTAILPVPPEHAKKAGKSGMAARAIGTGPYKFVSWKKGVSLVLVRNDDYWGEKPAIKNLVIRPIKESATQIAELLRGGVHVIRQVPPDQAEFINKSGTAVVKSAPVLRVVYLQIDQAGRDSRSHKALRDLRVRRAIAHAVNVDAIIKHILQGRAMRSATGISPLAFGYDDSAKPPKHDPALAKKLLAEAGYPNGFSVTLHTYSGSVMAERQVAEAILADLKQVGIETKIFHFDNVGVYTKMGTGGKRGDLTLASWGSRSIFDAHQILLPIFHSKDPLSYAKVPALDKEIDAGVSTVDAERRKQIYARAQKIILDEMLAVPMYGQHEIVGVNKDLEFEPAGDEILRLYEAKWKK
ncbi:MAG: hypothetical protein HYZ11_05095 [Candidatus Tectomicrobia bacterium]|uniref:Solute-binding protein family 5 domain-containing protein n=1 Tax=Tectimicrobiota bacterium TaxID=2528274 RepID=A0A932HYU4_UNCTE|nr:hypothetical protein [Candidatus Tectomicrobia bacterium]